MRRFVQEGLLGEFPLLSIVRNCAHLSHVDCGENDGVLLHPSVKQNEIFRLVSSSDNSHNIWLCLLGKFLLIQVIVHYL